MKKPESNLTDEQWARLEALENSPEDQIDTSDIPETADWSKARRGMFHRPDETAPTPAKNPTPTDTSEKGLESLITNSLTNNGWLPGDPQDYDRAQCVDLVHLSDFLLATQPETAAALSLDTDNPTRRQFLERLKREIGNRGIIDVLTKGHPAPPAPGNPLLRNTQPRQLPSPGTLPAEPILGNQTTQVQQRYAKQNSLDLALFINGLPIATMELKNRFTGQTVTHAVEQYRLTRDPREDLFRLGRCAVHFAADDEDVKFCTELKGKQSNFLPFNKGTGRTAARATRSIPRESRQPISGSKSSQQMD